MEKLYLKKQYTFDDYIVEESNQIAYSAAVSIANNEIRFNPLYICGGEGLGKTHLINAIGNYIIAANPELKVVYVKGEWFTKEVVNHIRYGTMTIFREKYREADVLLFDNFQYIINKKSTREEFYHTLSTLITADKQVVITADRTPKELLLDDRLSSRLSCGLVVTINRPELETRKEILKKAAKEYLVSEDLIDYLAESEELSTKYMLHIFNQVIVEAEKTGIKATARLAKQVCMKSLTEKDNIITVDKIIRTVSNYYHIPLKDILSSKRNSEFLKSRQVAMFLCDYMTKETRSSIGKSFGKNHSTIKHAIEKVEMILKDDQQMMQDIEEIKNKLSSGTTKTKEE